MPYIEQDDRTDCIEAMDANDNYIDLSMKSIGVIMGTSARNGGDIQFMLATALQAYMEEKGFRYTHMESVMGALTGALREFQREVVDPYESIKKKENGGVYELPRKLRAKLV